MNEEKKSHHFLQRDLVVVHEPYDLLRSTLYLSVGC